MHLHAGGQGVWASSMAGRLGAWPVLCGFTGGETGAVVAGLLARQPGERRLVASEAPTGCSVVDRRSGVRRLVAVRLSGPPSRHELDELVSATCAAALESEVLLVCNPFPADALPPETYATLVTDVRANGTRCSWTCPRRGSTPRSRAGPDLVKVNDWELAEYVRGPVDGPRLRAAAERLLAAGARAVLVTRGRRAGARAERRRRVRARPAALRPRLARGLRRHDDGRAGGGAGGRALVAGRAACSAPRRAPRTSCATGWAPAPRDVVEELAGRVELRRCSGSRPHAGRARTARRGPRRPRSPAGASRAIQSRWAATGSTSASRARAPDRRTGRPPCDECASLETTCTTPWRARASIPSAAGVLEVRGGRLHERAAPDEHGQPIDEVGGEVALGMGDEAAQAASGEVVDRRRQRVRQRPRARLEQDPAPAAAERQRPQLGVVEALDDRLGDLALRAARGRGSRGLAAPR